MDKNKRMIALLQKEKDQTITKEEILELKKLFKEYIETNRT